MNASKKILITPLDWGLGHATRCVPIIHELLNRGCEVQIATSGGALTLLRQEFPNLKFHELVSYRPHYSTLVPLAVSLAFQITKFVNCINQEHQQVEDIVVRESIDFVISDNRYGCWSKQVPSVFITHQLNILIPWTLCWIAPIVNGINHKLIRKHSFCWVPDEAVDRITGKMTEPKGMKVTYIGMLSRLKKINSIKRKYDVLVLISGPEPQRTEMERQLLKKLKTTTLRVLLVRGIPDATSELSGTANIVRKNHLLGDELSRVIEESEIVISRSGYSTIMDLARLNKKAIFIPTAGQTEQLYLAKELKKRKIAFSSSLYKLEVNKAIEISAGYTGFVGETNNDLLEKALDDLLS